MSTATESRSFCLHKPKSTFEEASVHKLVYISTARPNLSAAELADILQDARANNRRDGITGLLMLYQGQFFQVLEGDKDKVEACFERIEQDLRHKGIIVLMNEPATKRQFPDWDMGTVNISDFSEKLQADLIDLLHFRTHRKFDELHDDKIIGIFADTYLSDLSRFAEAVRN